MTEVVLAECHGQVWLVCGDEHIDDLLNGQLPEGANVEYVTLPNRSAVIEMWLARSAEATAGGMPWMINPALLARFRKAFSPGIRSVVFAAWSVMLDVPATETLTEAALWMAADAGRRVRLRQFAPAGAEPGKADLQRLRGQLALGVMVRAGAAAARVTEETLPAQTSEDGERMDVIEDADGA